MVEIHPIFLTPQLIIMKKQLLALTLIICAALGFNQVNAQNGSHYLMVKQKMVGIHSEKQLLANHGK